MPTAPEPAIRIESRDHLAELLAEAAEIEHGLMCCYLYAAFSLGEPARRGLPAAQADAVARWRDVILAVARDEMTHLALVANVANAIGASPRLGRLNFPVSPGAHPSGVVVSLAPFTPATLDHFVFLERPEGAVDQDGDGFAAPRPYQRGLGQGRLVPSAQDYATVGHLYRGIERGLADLAARLGEDVLFCGDPRLQLDAAGVGLAGVTRVVDLASAVTALETIVTQGEGARDTHHASHYCRFLAIRDELRAILAEDPGFAPASRVARNPVMRRPPTPEGLVWVDAEPAATVLDLGNATYQFMLRALTTLTSPVALAPGARALTTEAMATAMRALTPIAELLTTLPASTTVPDVHAGLTFTMSRSLEVMPEPRGAFRTLFESADRLAAGLRAHVVTLAPTMAAVADGLDDLAARLRAQSEVAAIPYGDGAAATTATTATATATAAAAYAPGPVEEARGRDLIIRFETARCIHARHCVTGAPRVFLANVVGPWIFPDEAPVDDLITIARTCPSGAITYERLDGGAPETAPPRNVVRVRENGPYAVHADLHLAGAGGAAATMTRATLCRCGASQRKPFCDGSHVAAGFAASGEAATRPSEPLHDGPPLEIRPQPDGPLMLSGPVEICTGTGRTIDRVDGARLCRCGGSATKPFCDGTHARIGFRAP